MEGKHIAISVVHMNRLGATGANRAAESLLMDLQELDPSVIAYTSVPEVHQARPERTRLVPAMLNQPGPKSNLLRILWYQFAMPTRIRKDRVGLLYSMLPEGMLNPRVRQVITIHDLLPLKYPADTPRLAWYYRVVVPRLLRSSSAVIADSEATKQDVERLYGPISKPIHVVYISYREDIYWPMPAPQVMSMQTKYGLNQYILTVGELRPHKNVRRLIQAFAKANLPGFQLAIVGRPHCLDPEIDHLPDMLGVSSRVKFLGFVPDEDLAALYSGARLFAYPSLNEGFGIPLAEAMACGCPIASSNVSCMPEVCGDAAHYFDPQDTDSMANALEELAQNCVLRQQLKERGFQRVTRYRRSNVIPKLLSTLKACLNNEPPNTKNARQ